MKIYTGGGDRGTTSLFSGERVVKSNDRIEAYGDIDELNAFLGMLISQIPTGEQLLVDEIHTLQSDLFQIGAWLATTPESGHTAKLKEMSLERVEVVESAIDRMEDKLEPLQNFILPAGHPASTAAHVARTVCRRAERRVVRLFKESDATQLPESLKILQIYLNRLSDYLFVLARYCNQISGVQDIAWK